jgi:hypothetical protein
MPQHLSTVHGGRDSWRAAPAMAIRPQPREIVPGSLSPADVALVGRWIALNRDMIGFLEQRHRHPRGAGPAATLAVMPAAA